MEKCLGILERKEIKMITFKGSYFEIGKQQGQIYRENGLNIDWVKINKKLLDGQLKAYQEHYPQLLEEIKGIAQGGGYDEEKMLQVYLANEILYYTNRFNIPVNCTIFGVKNKNGVFVGRNLDWTPIAEKIMQVYKREGSECLNFLAVTDMHIGSPDDVKNKFMFYNTIDVINENGLFIGITFAYGDSWQFGLSWRDMSKLISEACTTVNDAIKLFEKIPLAVPKNFFIADRKGNMAVVEHAVKRFKILPPIDNVLIQTNHYVDPELAKIDKVFKEIPHHNTFIRYYEALQKINWIKDKFKHSDVIKVLGNPQSYLLQNHESRTIWTLALDMQRSKYWLYTDVIGQKNKKTLEI